MNTSSQSLRRVLVIIASMAASILGACAGAWRLDVPVEVAWAEPTPEVVLWPWRIEHSNGQVRVTFWLIGQREVIGPRREILGSQLAFVGDAPVFRITDVDHEAVDLVWDNGGSWTPLPHTYDSTLALVTKFVGRTPDGRAILRATVKYHGRLWSGREYFFEWHPEAFRWKVPDVRPIGPGKLVPMEDSADQPLPASVVVTDE